MPEIATIAAQHLAYDEANERHVIRIELRGQWVKGTDRHFMLYKNSEQERPHPAPSIGAKAAWSLFHRETGLLIMWARRKKVAEDFAQQIYNYLGESVWNIPDGHELIKAVPREVMSWSCVVRMGQFRLGKKPPLLIDFIEAEYRYFADLDQNPFKPDQPIPDFCNLDHVDQTFYRNGQLVPNAAESYRLYHKYAQKSR